MVIHRPASARCDDEAYNVLTLWRWRIMEGRRTVVEARDIYAEMVLPRADVDAVLVTRRTVGMSMLERDIAQRPLRGDGRHWSVGPDRSWSIPSPSAPTKPLGCCPNRPGTDAGYRDTPTADAERLAFVRRATRTEPPA